VSSLPILLAQDGGELSADLMDNFGAMLPELFLCLMVVVMLIVDLVRSKGPSSLYPWLSLGGIVVAAGLVISGSGSATVGYDGFGALQIDGLGRLFKLVFLCSAALTVLFIVRSGRAFGRESEFQVILFGSLAGMCYLASATELIGFYVAFELVSYTGYLMAGYRLDSPKGAEAAGKYVIFGSVSSAVMLFGITLILGFTGTTQFEGIAVALMDAEAGQPALWVGAAFAFAGFAYKAAAFPFQFWCPDVYEGAPAPVAGFLAVASKAAVFAIGLRILAMASALGGVGGEPELGHLFADNAVFLEKLLILSSIATMLWGNLAALRQTNLQRMLAYSSIAHAGYLLMAATMVLRTDVADDALMAIGFYFMIYLCMNLGAFWIVTMMRRDLDSVEVSALKGLGWKQPLLGTCFVIMLVSLTGLPPTAGFVGKLLLFMPVIHEHFYLLAAIGLVNGAVSLYYYAKPIREMFLRRPDEDTKLLSCVGGDMVLVVALTVPLVVLGVYGWGSVATIARDAVAIVGGR
jgi:NADH-quinone oxidoreductase subunit N